MSLYHVNPETGNPNICRAQNGNCPFGTVSEHFESKAEARADYERRMNDANVTLKSVQKGVSARRDAKATETLRKALANQTRLDGATDSLVALSNKLVKQFNEGEPVKTAEEREARFPSAAALESNARKRIRESLVNHILENDDKIILSAIENGEVEVVGMDGVPMRADSPEAAQRIFTQLKQEMFGRRVGDVTHVAGHIGEVIKVHGDGTYDVRDNYDGKIYTLRDYINPLAGGKELKNFPDDEAHYDRTVIAWAQAKVGDDPNSAASYERRSIVFPNVGQLTKKRKIEIARVMWEFAGKDPAVFDEAREELQLNWADGQIARYGKVKVTKNDHGITIHTPNSIRSSDEFSTRLVEID